MKNDIINKNRVLVFIVSKRRYEQMKKRIAAALTILCLFSGFVPNAYALEQAVTEGEILVEVPVEQIPDPQNPPQEVQEEAFAAESQGEFLSDPADLRGSSLPRKFNFNQRISGELKVYDVAEEDSWAAAAAGAFSGMVQREGENDPQIDIWDIKDRMKLPEYIGDSHWPLTKKDRINREGKSLGMGYFASQKGPKETSEGRDYSLLEVDFLEQKDQVKDHIYNYGPVIGFMEINLDSEKLYRKDTCAYAYTDQVPMESKDYDGLKEMCVLIVGWDDDFSKENFYQDPEDSMYSVVNKGAWIVQLNRGKEVGKGGCIYVSYEDQYFKEYIGGVGYRKYDTSKKWQDRVYEYDKVIETFGKSDYLRWNTPNEYGKVYVMNVYDTKEIGEKVTGVGFTSPGQYKYNIWIAPDFKVGDGVELYRSNHWHQFAGEDWYGPGYHTVYYDEQEQWSYPEVLTEIEGEKFAVMLEIFTEGTEAISICGSYYKDYDGHKTEEGQSYYTNDIEDWKPFFYNDTETPHHMNASIKVFTTKPSEPVEPSELKEAELYSKELLTGDVSKEWTITFNKALDASSCTDETVRVYDAKTFKKVSVTHQVDESALKITPDQPYSSGSSYYIYLGDIKDTGGKKLSKAIKVLFKVE